jgi:hypothetical protein
MSNTTIITTSTISYPSGSYYVIIQILDTPAALSFNPILKSIGQITFGSDQIASFTMLPDSLALEMTIPKDMNAAHRMTNLLQRYDSIVRVYKVGVAKEYLLGLADKSSVNGSLLPTVRFTALSNLIDWKNDLTKDDSVDQFVKLSDYFFGTDPGTNQGDLLSTYTVNKMIDYKISYGSPASEGSIWDMYFNKQIFLHSRTPYQTVADMNKSMLANFYSLLMGAPFRQAYLLPYAYDGSDLFVIDKTQIIDFQLLPLVPKGLNINRRQNNKAYLFNSSHPYGYIDYRNELYVKGTPYISGFYYNLPPLITIPPVAYQSIYSYGGINLLVTYFKIQNDQYYFKALPLNRPTESWALPASGTMTRVSGPGDASIDVTGVSYSTLDNDGTDIYIPFPLGSEGDRITLFCNNDGHDVPDSNTFKCCSLYYNVANQFAYQNLCNIDTVKAIDRSGNYGFQYGSSFEQIAESLYHLIYDNMFGQIKIKITGTGNPLYKFIRLPNFFAEFSSNVYRCIQYKPDLKTDTTECLIQIA